MRTDGNAGVKTYASSAEAIAVHAPTLVPPLAAEVLLPRRKSWLVRFLLIHSDIFALLLAFFAAEWILDPSTVAAGHLSTRGGLFLLTLPAWIVGVKLLGLYERDDELINYSTLDEIPKLFQLATVGAWGIVVLSWATSVGVDLGVAVTFWALATCLLPLVRALVRTEYQRHPEFPQNTVVVGAGSVGQLLGRKFLQHPEYHVNLLGFVDDNPRERRQDLGDLTLLGSPEDLPDLIDRLAVERVVIAFSNESHEQTMDLIRALKDHPVRIDIVPRLFDVIPPRLTSHTVEGIPLLTLPPLRLSGWRRFLKRSFDVSLALVATVLLAPVFALTALLIKLDSKGPVFFRQLRMGAGERPFFMFKFRTMVVDADERKEQVAHLNKHARPGGDPRMFKISRDPRITRVGWFLRRYSVDELPQLLNVLKGDMSMIGPRPLILEEDRFVESWARKRLLLKPGITGLWQVLGRTAIPFEEMVKLDYVYVTTWSLANDVRLLLQTVPVVFKGDREDAY
jgi:exopolysaccharide biosynthesis polyprenyl glycosylphosphotransferase